MRKCASVFCIRNYTVIQIYISAVHAVYLIKCLLNADSTW